MTLGMGMVRGDKVLIMPMMVNLFEPECPHRITKPTCVSQGANPEIVIPAGPQGPGVYSPVGPDSETVYIGSQEHGVASK